MGDGLRTIYVVTTDESIVAQCRAACSSMDGWEVSVRKDYESLLSEPPAQGDVILIDKFLWGGNVYETCAALVGKTRCRIFVVCEFDNQNAEAIARFFRSAKPPILGRIRNEIFRLELHAVKSSADLLPIHSETSP